MSSPRVEALLVAIAVSFRLAPDHMRAERILESAMRDLLDGQGRRVAVDGIGAPLLPHVRRPEDIPWWELRAAVKEFIRAVGIEEAASRFGTAPTSLRNIVNRTKSPSLGRRERMAAMLMREPANDAGAVKTARFGR